MAIDDHLDKIVGGKSNNRPWRGRCIHAPRRITAKLAIAGRIGALALALGFTALTVHSITVPLKQLDRSMASITHGDLNVEMPPQECRRSPR